MAIAFDAAFRSEAALALSQIYEGGYVEIRDSSNTVLSTITVGASAFEDKGGGTAGLVAELTDIVDVSGTADNYRAVTSGGGIETGTITATGGGGDMTMDNVNLVQGGVAKITTWNNTYPASA